MTQDELAKAAEVSPRTVSDRERGINRTARKDPAELLATAMGLTGHEREQFLAAARGKPAAAGRADWAEAAAEASAAAPGSARAEADGTGDDSGASNLGWLGSAVTGDFVGRQRELGVLREAWSRATAGHRVLTLVGGEPGIGKTALTGELARLARADEGLVLYGRWDEHVLAPYQALREALTDYARACPAALLRRDPGDLGGGIRPPPPRTRPGGSASPPPSPSSRPRPSASGCSSRLTRGSSGWGHGIPCCWCSTTCHGRAV